MRFSQTIGVFYPIDIEYSSLPADLIEVPQEDFAAAMARSPGDTLDVVNGRVVVVPKPDLQAPSLDQVKAAALSAIDTAAGAARARYITTADGQAATYLLKAADADRYKAAGYPAAQIASYPWVRAKARAMVAIPAAADYQAAADLIIATRDAWVSKGAAIEEARERGKAAVSAAADVAGVAAAREAAIAELMLL